MLVPLISALVAVDSLFNDRGQLNPSITILGVPAPLCDECLHPVIPLPTTLTVYTASPLPSALLFLSLSSSAPLPSSPPLPQARVWQCQGGLWSSTPLSYHTRSWPAATGTRSSYDMTDKHPQQSRLHSE